MVILYFIVIIVLTACLIALYAFKESVQILIKEVKKIKDDFIQLLEDNNNTMQELRKNKEQLNEDKIQAMEKKLNDIKKGIK